MQDKDATNLRVSVEPWYPGEAFHPLVSEKHPHLSRTLRTGLAQNRTGDRLSEQLQEVVRINLHAFRLAGGKIRFCEEGRRNDEGDNEVQVRANKGNGDGGGGGGWQCMKACPIFDEST